MSKNKVLKHIIIILISTSLSALCYSSGSLYIAESFRSYDDYFYMKIDSGRVIYSEDDSGKECFYSYDLKVTRSFK